MSPYVTKRSVILSLVILLLYAGSVWGQAYSLQGSKVVIGSKDHWSNWIFSPALISIDEDGALKPREFHRDINATLNASDFLGADGKTPGGIRGVGSNSRDAANVMDGDSTTYWEPSPNDPVRDWWVEINLGRAVHAHNIILKFAKEGEGDPFLQFRVYVSFGGEAFKGSKLIPFATIGRTTQPNKDQRVFEFPLEFIGTVYNEGDFAGEVIQYVRIQATDSDLERAHEISETEYNELSDDDRGAIAYFRKTFTGAEREITQGEYEKLSADRQGSVRYYRQERPRLVEVEVWSEGDNMGLGILERNGSVSATGVSRSLNGFDGDFTSKWNAMAYSPYRDQGLLIVDLGAKLWVDTINILTNVVQAGWLDGLLFGYITRVSDGSKAPDGSLIWEMISPKDRDDNPRRVVRFMDSFPLRQIRYVEFKNIDVTGAASGGYAQYGYLSEMQIFGRGYAPDVQMKSGLVELGGTRNLTSIEWDADQPEGVLVEIQTRTGDDLEELKRFFDKNGNELTEQNYNSLPAFRKGEEKVEFIPGPGWSTWSPPYQRSGDQIVSPSPRKYMELQVALTSSDPDVGAVLRSITVNFMPPVAQSLVGEVYPFADVTVGEPRVFSYYLKPTVLPGDPGLDELLIVAPPATQMQLLDVRVGKEDSFPSETYTESDGTLQVLRDNSDSLWVRLPKVVGPGGANLIQVRFRSTIFLNGTLFNGSAGNSTIDNSWQRVDAGDATFLTPSKGTVVGVPAGDRIVGNLVVLPNPFTPNADGTNDQARFEFTVFKVNTAKAVEVIIYDLAGRQVRKLMEERPSAAGLYTMEWDGKDEDGKVVTPGIYVGQISLDTDEVSVEDSIVSQPVYVAY